jgi:hypothetical protein
MFNYYNYSIVFLKLLFMNKLMLGIPYILIKHIIIDNVLHITYQGGKYVILGIGSGIYYLAFPKPIHILDYDKPPIPDECNELGNITNSPEL